MLARKALAGTAAAPKVYVEDVFSTYLYTGNGSTQTITNGIDLSGEGGLVWTKSRNLSGGHALIDTVRGTGKQIGSNSTDAEKSANDTITAFNNSGYSLGADSTYGNVNISSSYNYASWTFRKAKKFFDIVTYTGNGTQPRTIAHNLGSVPGCIIVKRTDTTSDWAVYHRAVDATTPQGYRLELNTTNARTATSATWNNQAPTSTEFYIGSATYNASGGTYVAYLFAHNAGGFGDAGDQNVITCNSFTTDGSGNATVSLGYEPQWLLIKKSSSTDGGVSDRWHIYDTVRGIPTGASDRVLDPNNNFAEYSTNFLELTPTGFNVINAILPASETFIYIAIRRGPMKTPETGTEVFYPYVTASVSNVGSTGGTMYNSQIVTDLAWQRAKGGTDGWYLGTRLTGTAYLKSEETNAESTSAAIVWDSNRGAWSFSDANYGLYCFKRAPGFMDVVCYTGTGSARTVSHNLGVAPELMIIKNRSSVNAWNVNAVVLGTSGNVLNLATSAAAVTSSSAYNSTAPTSSVFTVGTAGGTNSSGETYVAYLFASVTGVSKVGSYTGNGSSVTVTTGFQPRFILVKRTNSTGNWIVSDSARGLVAGNDPYLLLNSTAAEDTDEDWVDVSSTGFTVNQVTASNANVNTGTYIYLAIA